MGVLNVKGRTYLAQYLFGFQSAETAVCVLPKCLLIPHWSLETPACFSLSLPMKRIILITSKYHLYFFLKYFLNWLFS